MPVAAHGLAAHGLAAHGFAPHGFMPAAHGLAAHGFAPHGFMPAPQGLAAHGLAPHGFMPAAFDASNLFWTSPTYAASAASSTDPQSRGSAFIGIAMHSWTISAAVISPRPARSFAMATSCG
jgi:hypothetical protein